MSAAGKGNGMRHLMLTIQYRGTAYQGFQVQGDKPTVAKTLQDAIETVFKSRLDIKGCSRTDAGVHANRFAVCFFTGSDIPCDAVVRALNVNLPEDIAVLGCEQVADAFHPRYDCRGKRYLYKIHNHPVKNPFAADLMLYHKYPLDVGKMDRAAKGFCGRYDFSAFCSAGSKVEDMVRTITDAAVYREGTTVIFSVTGDGFLYHMVRIMVGTLLEVARGAIAPEAIPSIILSRDRACAGPTAPAHGLYLDEVFYD